MSASRTKKPRSGHSPETVDGRAIDEIYGLEPVIDPQLERSAWVRSQWVRCPYCGESFETALDLSAGSASYVEDCQICCRPIEFRLEVDHEGTLTSFDVSRGD
ncbi:MAG TPA: CPXCG motif-containing cysteine-rich protein [Steroidobacteraceae bacterium]|nr:CPXCG motif-containing cysteine-rich protein [Steroidobacteraceae bacterium]